MLLIVSVRPLPCQVRLLGRSKNLIKKRIFLGFEGGDGTGLFIYLFCPALPLLCYGFLLSLSLSQPFTDTNNVASYKELKASAGISTSLNINTSPKGILCYCHINFQIYYLSLPPASGGTVTISYLI